MIRLSHPKIVTNHPRRQPDIRREVLIIEAQRTQVFHRLAVEAGNILVGRDQLRYLLAPSPLKPIALRGLRYARIVVAAVDRRAGPFPPSRRSHFLCNHRDARLMRAGSGY